MPSTAAITGRVPAEVVPRPTSGFATRPVRVSTGDQSVEAQRHSIGLIHKVEEWFSDEDVSGVVRALDRPGFSDLLK